MYYDSHSSYKFGDGPHVKAVRAVRFPACFGQVKVLIDSDIVDKEIPLLLSKPAMQKSDTNIDFKNDTVTIFGVKQKLATTTSGHYMVLITRNSQNS